MVYEARPGSILSRKPLRRETEESSATSKYLTSNDTTEEFSLSEDGYDEEFDPGCTGGSYIGSKGNMSRSPSRTPARPTNKPAMFSPSDNSKESAQSNQQMPVVRFLVVAAVVVAAFLGLRYSGTAKMHCDFKSLREQHREQSEYVWKSLRIGIENILNQVSHTPAVYLMVYGKGGSVNVKRLIRDIATESSKCFGGTLKLVEMSADDFKSEKVKNDYGYAIEKFKSKMKNGKVALIVDLNEIPPETARALHVICDTVSPPFSDVVIFLSLRVPAEIGTSIHVVEGVLRQLWGSKLTRNELDPLITRVTDQIVQIQN